MINLLTLHSYLTEAPTSIYLDGGFWVYDNDLLVDENGNKVPVRIPHDLFQEALIIASSENPSQDAMAEVGRKIAACMDSQIQNVQLPENLVSASSTIEPTNLFAMVDDAKYGGTTVTTQANSSGYGWKDAVALVITAAVTPWAMAGAAALGISVVGTAFVVGVAIGVAVSVYYSTFAEPKLSSIV